jgi:hypothetical protein
MPLCTVVQCGANRVALQFAARVAAVAAAAATRHAPVTNSNLKLWLFTACWQRKRCTWYCHCCGCCSTDSTSTCLHAQPTPGELSGPLLVKHCIKVRCCFYLGFQNFACIHTHTPAQSRSKRHQWTHINKLAAYHRHPPYLQKVHRRSRLVLHCYAKLPSCRLHRRKRKLAHAAGTAASSCRMLLLLLLRCGTECVACIEQI